jgi:hypothetical protein
MTASPVVFAWPQLGYVLCEIDDFFWYLAPFEFSFWASPAGAFQNTLSLPQVNLGDILDNTCTQKIKERD